MEQLKPETRKTGSPSKSKFWSYLSHRELDFFPTGKLQLWLIIILVFSWTVEQFEKAKMAPVLTYLLEDFNITLSKWGIIATIATILSAISQYFFGYLADVYGRKKLIFWPILAYAFIAIGTVLAQNFITVSILYVLGLVVISGLFPVIAAAFRDITPRGGRALSYSWFALAFSLGSLSSNGAAAAILPIWPGWRPQYWVAAGVALLMAIVVGLLYRDLSERVRGKIFKDETEKNDNKTDTTLLSGYSSLQEAKKSGNLIYKDWRLWLLNLGQLFWTIVYVTIVAYIPLYFKQFFGIEPAKAASLTNVFWFVAIFSIFLGGWISDKLQVRKTISIFGSITTGIMLIVLSTLPSNTSTTLLIIIWALAGIATGFIYPAWCALLSENAESISPFGVARAFGVAGILGAISGVFLHLGLPVFVEKWGWSSWMLFGGILCFVLSIFTAFGRGPWWVSKSKSV